jgi:hypothetical protein
VNPLFGLLASALIAAPMAPTATATPVDRAVAALRAGPGVYLDAAAVGHPLSRADVAKLRDSVSSATTPVYVAALGESTRTAAGTDLQRVIDGVHSEGTYVVVGTGGFVARSDVPGVTGQTASLVDQAIAAHRGQPLAELTEFVSLVSSTAASAGGDGGGATTTDPSVTLPDQTDRSTGPPAGLFVGLIAVVAVGAIGIRTASRRRRQREDAAALAEVRVAADQDVTALGTELTALDVPPAGAPEATEDYQAALDAYDRAKVALERARHPVDVRAVSLALEEGRWRLACVRARLADKPVPERRPPCFFNPQHGPSTTDVDWTPPGGAARNVPVCAADADRVARGVEPDERMVPAGGGMVPYWRAPGYYAPYAGGFFGGWGGGGFLGGLLLGEMMMSPGLGWGAYDSMAYDGGYDSGYASGYDAGFDNSGGGDFAGGFDGGGGGGWDGGGGGGGGWDGGGGGGFDGGGGGGGDGGGGGW